MNGQAKWTPAWTAAAGMLAAVVVVEVEQLHLLPFAWWGLPGVAVFGALITALFELNAWPRTHLHRASTWLAAGVWTTWVSAAGWSAWAWLTLAGGAAVLAAAAPWCRTPAIEATPATGARPAVNDRRPAAVREWEQLLRGLTRSTVVVKDVVPWDRKADGAQVHLALPLGMTWRDLAQVCDQIAAARKLPPGCNVRVLEGSHQGEAILDVMLRDSLADPVVVPGDVSAVSITDPFAVMYSPRNEPLEMCLREQSMVVGGAPGSGKTTLLHRLIRWLARCTDTLIWVMDPNGGGVAEPWIGPWARGEATEPIIDWVADDEASAAVMVAVASKIAKDRKTSRIAVERKRAARTMVLPVDRDLPAIVVLCDEGGEMRQTGNLLAQLAINGLSRLAQIGRAEAIRVVLSVLRGTADLTDKGLRVNAALRICLRMEEEDEYSHVLGSYPGSTRLVHTGSGYVRRSVDPRPVFARSADYARDAMERDAIALAALRPKLDARAQLVASRVRVKDVLDGREPTADVLRLRVIQDVQDGRAYEGRWDRYEHKLAEMRGEDLLEVDDDEPESEQDSPAEGGALAPVGPALSDLTRSFGLDAQLPPTPPRTAPVREASIEPEDVDQAASVLLAELDAPKLTTREQIILVLGDVYPESLSPDQIGAELERRTGKAGNRTHRQDVLKLMVEKGEAIRYGEGGNDGRYALRKR